MLLWIAFTLMAALMQAIRTACQKTLAAVISIQTLLLGNGPVFC